MDNNSLLWLVAASQRLERMESHRQKKSLGEDSDKKLLFIPGFRGAALVAVEVHQRAVRMAGTASVFTQGCMSVPSPMHELLNPL